MIKKIKHYTSEYTALRYIIAGSTSACVNLSVLYIFYRLIGLFYLTSSIIAFIVAFFVSWALHKFWTFKDHSMDGFHKQGVKYLVSSLFGLSLNTTLMYIFVSLLHIWVLLAQVVAGLMVAGFTFFISKHLIFNGVKK
jgi:putative flippase GtrA